jgi:hypothetical protein
MPTIEHATPSAAGFRLRTDPPAHETAQVEGPRGTTGFLAKFHELGQVSGYSKRGRAPSLSRSVRGGLKLAQELSLGSNVGVEQ